jgi:hypothetical protein
MKREAASIQIRLGVALALSAALMSMQALAGTAHPNLQGFWVSEQGPGGRGGPGMGPPGAGGPLPGGRGSGGRGPRGGGARPEATDAGIAAAKGYEQPYDDPAIKCDIANIIFGWTHDQNINEIKQVGNTLKLTYGYMDFVRTIHMDGAHPNNLKPSRGGHSTGRWEGDTLVVDTIALAPSVLIPMAGIMLSDKAHIIEKFSLASGGQQLVRNYVVEDPLYLKQPHSGSDVMVASKEPYTPYECVELSGDNNKRPGK